MDARRRRFLFRAVGGIALLLILAGSITDVAVTMFWDRNAMLTSVLADVLVLLVGVAVVNEWLDIRSAERWRTVAYYALVELLEASRDTWIRLSHELDLAQGEPMTVMQLSDRVLADGGAAMLRDRAAAALADPEARARLLKIVAEVSDETRTALTNWAPIMITTAPSAAAINRFTRSARPPRAAALRPPGGHPGLHDRQHRGRRRRLGGPPDRHGHPARRRALVSPTARSPMRSSRWRNGRTRRLSPH